MSKQRLLFITTGGTIASVRTAQGLKPVLTSEELLAHLPELQQLCCPETLNLCSIDSTDLGQEHWLMMARAIQENYALYDGFIICHGTDTLAYSAAALSYLIQNADKPIILTGAQQPISNEITDAKKNLRDSVICALDPGSRGVMVVFGGHVIAIIEVGWAEARPTRRDDARLLDSVSQYLSIEFAAAISTMRTERAQRLDRVAMRLHDLLEDGPNVDEHDLEQVKETLSTELGVELAPVSAGALDGSCVACLPSVGNVELPCALEELTRGYADAGVAVAPIRKGSALDTWLTRAGRPSTGAIVDLGEIGGRRRAFLVLRAAGEEPVDVEGLDFLRRVCVDVRQAAEEGERRVHDTRIAQALQSGMKNELQRIEGITAHGLYSSATEAALVGGDFYDLIRLPNRRACVILGDVSGKGVEAASVSAAVRTALGAYAWEGQPPARMVRLLNDFLLGFSRLETFATLFVGVIDLAHATLTYCSAGHPPAIFLRRDPHEMFTLDEQSGVVGAFRGMSYHDGRVRLREGDRLLLYTDGGTEARNPSGAFFGEQGLRDAVMEEAAGDYEHMLDRLLARLDAFTERSLDDDIAMVTLRFDELGGE